MIHPKTKQVLATAFATGSTHDFQRFKRSRPAIASHTVCLADAGYQGLTRLHANSCTPFKKSKLHPLTPDQKAANRLLSAQRIAVEHVIAKLKVFRILAERYRNRRRRFALRFNLIAAIYNSELPAT
jgi:transposase